MADERVEKVSDVMFKITKQVSYEDEKTYGLDSLVQQKKRMEESVKGLQDEIIRVEELINKGKSVGVTPAVEDLVEVKP